MRRTSVLLSILIYNGANISFAQTCQDFIHRTAPDSRYEIAGNGDEIKDKQTGLIWQRCSVGQLWNGTSCNGTPLTYNWANALKVAQSLGNGYRLPNIKELGQIGRAHV